MTLYPIESIPFSFPGSYLTIGKHRDKTTHLVYRTRSSRAVSYRNTEYWASDHFEIHLLRNGIEVTYTWQEHAHCLDLIDGNTVVASFTFADTNTILVQSKGIRVKFISIKPLHTAYSPVPGRIHLVDGAARCHHIFQSVQSEELFLTPPLQSPIGNNHRKGIFFEVELGESGGAIRFSETEEIFREPLPGFTDTLHQRKKEWQSWYQKLPRVAERYRSAAEEAWYLMWSSEVAPKGLITRRAIFMSKYWMNSIWSWDNCFNALAVARAEPVLAWDQLLLFFEHQDRNGISPDQINDMYEHFCFTKPPIHGWTILNLIEILGENACLPYIQQLYQPMCKLTNWWYSMRDFDGDGICHYHHGNDSGWDNATAFDEGYPAESPDLSAHLALQCFGLAKMAALLGRAGEASSWQIKGETQVNHLIHHSYRDGKFVTLMDGTHQVAESLSLLNLMPVELGAYLPRDIFSSLLEQLKPGGLWLTEYGPATEAPSSIRYESNGYWRGPIWGPSTYLIFTGLVHGGETALARQIAQRFCDMCVKSPGFWENYDAVTGAGLDCPGYTWTAACFLLMAEWLERNPA